jgi:hypothetical protein
MEMESENGLEKYLILRQEVVLESLSALAFSSMEKLELPTDSKERRKWLDGTPQGYRPQRREVFHKHSTRNEQISSGGIFRNSGKKHN